MTSDPVLPEAKPSDDGDITSPSETDGRSSSVVSEKGFEPRRRDHDVAVAPPTATVAASLHPPPATGVGFLSENESIFKVKDNYRVDLDNFITWSSETINHIDFGYFKRKMPEGKQLLNTPELLYSCHDILV